MDRLKKYDVVWFNGGNTYMLRWVIEQVGGEKMIKEMLKSGVVYGGDSAGAIVVGPTLKHFSGEDDPSVAPEVLYDGLGLIDFAILPHWGSEKFGEVSKVRERKLNEDGYKTRRLTDEEFVLVEDEKLV